MRGVLQMEVFLVGTFITVEEGLLETTECHYHI